MEKKFSKIFCFIILLIPIMLYGCKAETIITKEYKDINKLTITYHDTSIVLNINKGEKVIKEIYDCIVKTNLKTHQNPTEMESQLSDPLYTIEFNFNDNTKNLIYSTETGELIYRLLDKQGSWIGGKNRSLKEKIIKLFPSPQQIKNFSLKRLIGTEDAIEYPATIITRHESICIFKEIKIIDNYIYFSCKDLNNKELFLAISGNIDDHLINKFKNNKEYIGKRIKIKWNKVRAYFPEDKSYYIESVLSELIEIDKFE